MGKNPAFFFYPKDWMMDLSEHPLEIEGAWIRIVAKIWWEQTGGESTKTLSQWARLLGVGEERANEILDYLQENGICDIVTKMSQNCHSLSRLVTLKSRRMVKECNARENARLRKQKSRASQKCHKIVTPPLPSPSPSPSPNKEEECVFDGAETETELKKKRSQLVGRLTNSDPALGEWLDPADDVHVMGDVLRALLSRRDGKPRALSTQVKVLENLDRYPLLQVLFAAQVFIDKDVPGSGNVEWPYERYFLGMVRRTESEYLEWRAKNDKEVESGTERPRQRSGEGATSQDTGGVAGFRTAGDVLRDLRPLQRASGRGEQLRSEESDPD